MQQGHSERRTILVFPNEAGKKQNKTKNPLTLNTPTLYQPCTVIIPFVEMLVIETLVIIVQELSVLTSLLASVDVKIY